MTRVAGVSKVLSVVGARPNFMKVAPVSRALAARRVRHVVVHTGQHYDADMSDVFFRDLRLPRPDHNLEVGSGSHRRQTAEIMDRFEPVCLAAEPDVVLVRELLGTLAIMANDGAVLFPVHPRTKARIEEVGLNSLVSGSLRLLDPMPYLEMLSLVAEADLVITDSGGLQEETTWLGVPCVTVRPNTERPITCTLGTNRLASVGRQSSLSAAREARGRRPAAPPTIERWDGLAADRIAATLCDGTRFE